MLALHSNERVILYNADTSLVWQVFIIQFRLIEVITRREADPHAHCPHQKLRDKHNIMWDEVVHSKRSCDISSRLVCLMTQREIDAKIVEYS